MMIISFILVIFSMIMSIAMPIFFFIVFYKIIALISNPIKLDKNFPKYKDISYYRNIPCDGDIEKAYFILLNYKIVKKEVLNDNIISAFLLKWIDLEYVKIIDDKNLKIDLGNSNFPKTYCEEKLYLMLKTAALENNILEIKEFKKWSRKNYRQIRNWFRTLKYNGANAYFYQEKLKNPNVILDIKQEAINLIGLKKFLIHFSEFDDKEIEDVQLWQQYLIFAQLMGISKKIEKQFEKLNLKFEEMLNSSFSTIGKFFVFYFILNYILPITLVIVITIFSLIFGVF